MGQKEAEWWLATSKDQVGVISNYGNGGCAKQQSQASGSCRLMGLAS